jgi:hypothetical protein
MKVGVCSGSAMLEVSSELVGRPKGYRTFTHNLWWRPNDARWHRLNRIFHLISSLKLKLNISNPATGAQKLIDIDDDKKLRPFMDKRISQEVDASCLGNEWKVYK